MRQFSDLHKKKQKNNAFAILIGVFFSIALCSCTTTKFSIITTGQIRPAISPEVVKVYVDPPAKYETIAIIDASREVDGSKQTTQNIVINDLKTQAAKMGANGILLIGIGNQSRGGVVIGKVFVPSEAVTTQGRAIYVIQE